MRKEAPTPAVGFAAVLASEVVDEAEPPVLAVEFAADVLFEPPMLPADCIDDAPLDILSVLVDDCVAGALPLDEPPVPLVARALTVAR